MPKMFPDDEIDPQAMVKATIGLIKRAKKKTEENDILSGEGTKSHEQLEGEEQEKLSMKKLLRKLGVKS